jgi:hypothetical protein
MQVYAARNELLWEKTRRWLLFVRHPGFGAALTKEETANVTRKPELIALLCSGRDACTQKQFHVQLLLRVHSTSRCTHTRNMMLALRSQVQRVHLGSMYRVHYCKKSCASLIYGPTPSDLFVVPGEEKSWQKGFLWSTGSWSPSWRQNVEEGVQVRNIKFNKHSRRDDCNVWEWCYCCDIVKSLTEKGILPLTAMKGGST